VKKKIVTIVTAVSCLTSFVSPALAEHKGGHHGGSGNHGSSTIGHGGHSFASRGGKSGGKGGGNSGDTVSDILGIVRDVVDR
jgi:hypothetical protein